MESDETSQPPADSTPVEDEPTTAQPEQADRPRMVYLALAAGAATLLLLLGIIWFASRDDGGGGPILCLGIDPDEAESLILSGEVSRADILLDIDDPVNTLTAIQLELENGDCRSLPEGADNSPMLHEILGYLTIYNEQGPGGVQIVYQKRAIPLELLSTSTPTPTETPLPTETVSPSPTSVTSTPVPTQTPAATRTAVPQPSPREGSPSPVASPAASASPGSI